MVEQGFDCPANFTLKGIENRGPNNFHVRLKCNYGSCGEQRNFMVNGYAQGSSSAQDDAVSNAEQEMALQCPLEQIANR